MNTCGKTDSETVTDCACAPDFMLSLANWREGATGDWAKDNAVGRGRANEMRANLKMTGNHPAVLQCMKMLVENGHFGGIEVGFFQRLSEFAAR